MGERKGQSHGLPLFILPALFGASDGTALSTLEGMTTRRPGRQTAQRFSQTAVHFLLPVLPGVVKGFRMTYCVGMKVKDGIVLIADTRTNAGVDNISTYQKLHVTEIQGERTIAIATAGSLSVTQSALTLAANGIMMPGSDQAESLTSVPTMFRAAQLVGYALRQVRQEIGAVLQAENINVDATALLGGQIGEGPMGLYLIYSQGNFIECQPDTPYLQIGELKYGKPILDRGLRDHTILPEALKLGLLSFHSTLRSNVSVGLPLDLVIMRTGALNGFSRRIEPDDPYFRNLGHDWNKAISDAYSAMPYPSWIQDGL